MNELTLGNGSIIQVAEHDFANQFDWATAILMCQGMGEGWRLPTIYEIEHIFENKAKFDFANYGCWAYWSGDAINTEQAFGFCGVEGNIVKEFKTETFYVRAVKIIV
jgi:hypothetical protein